MKSYRKLVVDKYGEEPPHETALVFVAEASRVMYQLFTALRHHHNADAYIAYAKSEMIDVIAQLNILCEALGWDYVELEEMAYEKLQEGVERKR